MKMRKRKMKKFSLNKYIKWCEENNEEFYSWAIECSGKEVKKNKCGKYIIHRDWVMKA